MKRMLHIGCSLNKGIVTLQVPSNMQQAKMDFTVFKGVPENVGLSNLILKKCKRKVRQFCLRTAVY